MLPSCRHFMAFIGAEELIKNHGFVVKVIPLYVIRTRPLIVACQPGAAVKLRQEKREGYTDFIELDPENIAWNVVRQGDLLLLLITSLVHPSHFQIRSQFDELLLRHASNSGVKVFDGLKITDIKFSGERPVSAIYETQDSQPREINFEYLVDASGRTGIMSTKYLKNRQFTKSLMNMAFWGYWRGGGRYAPGTNRENAPWFEAFTGNISIGVVIAKDSYAEKKALASNDVNDPITRLYINQLAQAPGLMQLLGKAELTSEVKSAGDYSYSASQYAGPGYRIAGDAGAFIDPLFSSGVHLAFTGGLSAASTSIRGDCTEAKAAEFHNSKVGVSYTRFLITVLGVYKQIRAQKEDVLADVDEDNFDKAFRLLRPVIQGAADIDPRLTPQELEETLNFCKCVMAPTQPQMHREVAERMPDLTAPDGPILRPCTVSAIVGDDEDAKHVVLEINARKVIHVMYGLGHFRNEILHGYYINLIHGELGMREA
ncbi:hypothetical protein C0995_003578 [Termitomyces sp. Mi166|nr:hypothetical protein C0995_003578 [Termitomyces sp. Mi166\